MSKKKKKILIYLYSLKTLNFHSPKILEEFDGMKLNLMKFLLRLLNILCHLF